ncbi:MAG: DUF3857 domain-containing protein [Myxococcales bacterium]|nr:DUF3857 domain-containing protein [Myxococcales bacterium]
MPIPHLAFFLAFVSLPAPPASGLLDTLQRLERSRGNLRAIIPLWELPTVWSYASRAERERLIRALHRVARDEKNPLPLRRLALRLLADRLRSACRDAEARVAWRALGNLGEFWLVGPFPNPGERGLDTPQAPEQGPPGAGSMPGKNRPVAWRRLPPASPDGKLALESLFADDEPQVAYLLTGFHLEQAAEAVLWTGCADGCKAWLDRQPVLSDPGPHPLRPDQSAVQLRLAAGDHALLIKVARGGGAFALSVSLTDPAGRPLAGLRTITGLDELARTWTAAPGGSPDPRPRPTLADLAQPASGRQGADDLVLRALALDLADAGDVRRKEPERLFEEALQKLPPHDERQARFRQWLALITDDPQRQRALLEEALRLRSNDAEAAWRLGRLFRALNDPARAIAALEKARRTDPRHVPTQLEWCELQADLHLDGRAQRQIEDLVERHPDVPEVLHSGGLLLRRLGNLRAGEVLTAAGKASCDDASILRSRLEIAVEQGRIDEALGLLDRLIEMEPWHSGWLIERGELRAANGRAAEALTDFEAAARLLPDDPVPVLRRAEMLLRRGDTPGAIAAFQTALALTPQDQNLARRVRWLQPGGHPFQRPYELDARALMAEPAGAWPEAPAVRLADRTVVRLYENGMSLRYHQEVIRIQNKAGAERLRTFRIEYAPDRQQVRVHASRLLRSDGSVDTSATTRDYSLSEPWYNLYYDVHAREISFPQVSAGDTLELAWEIDDIGGGALLERFFGDLCPLQFEEPVLSSSYLLLAPEKIEVHGYASPGVARRVEPARDGDERLRLYRFEAAALPGLEPEPGAGGFTSHHAFVHVSTFRDWNEVGAWYHDLVAGALRPGPQVEQLAREQAAAVADPLERVRKLYQFVANGLRYVGLEFGVHGYVPYPVEQVLERRFGDCKDKSALLAALLNLSGIRAEMALLRMKRLGDLPDEPASLAPFNHAVCYLPDHDLWLDGTAAFHDIRELPAQDQDTLALVITPRGGRLVRTPLSKPEQNRTSIEFELRPDERGDGGGEVRIRLQGVLAPDLRMRFFAESDVRGLAEKTLSELFPGIRVTQASVHNVNEPERPLEIHAAFLAPHLARPTATGLDVPLLGRETFYQRLYAVLHQRVTALELGPPWSVEWRVRWIPPDGMRLDTVVEDGHLDTPFGRVETRCQREGNGAQTRAAFTLVASRVSTGDYPAFRDFVSRADRMLSRNLRFVRGDTP